MGIIIIKIKMFSKIVPVAAIIASASASLNQHSSIPACHSAGCKKDSYGKPPSNAAETGDFGKMNDDWMRAYDTKLV